MTNRTKPSANRLNYAAGALLLLVAAVAAGLLSAKHIWSISLPGCGPQAGCDWILNSTWSRVFGFPVAFLGLGFFVSMLALWLMTSRRGCNPTLLFASRIGAFASLVLVAVMISTGHLCTWCLTAHVANLAWYVLIEVISRSRVRTRLTAGQLVIACLVFAVVTGSMRALEYRQKLIAEAAAHQAALESISKMTPEPPPPVDTIATTPENESAKPKSHGVKPSRFGGRYWTGKSDAPVRLVIFQDYQCKLCKEAESILRGLLRSRTDLTISVKQWPFDRACNRHIIAENIHPGACLAARCAEAAGQVGGATAFWSMHNWLVDHDGNISTSEAMTEAGQLGLDSALFAETLSSAKIDSVILADIDEGLLYGLKFTPMVFVNGYELKGWQSAGAIPAAIERAAQLAKQQPRSGDQPDSAINVQFEQWLAQPRVTLPVTNEDHQRGPLNAPVAIIMFGDISDPYNVLADQMLKPSLRDTLKTCFIFRTFPLRAECNDMVKRPMNPHACEAARLAEAAGIVGGEPAFWKMRSWILDNQEKFDSTRFADAATACSLDAASLSRISHDPRVTDRIKRNIDMAKALGINSSPTIFVNGRKVADWRTPGLLHRVIMNPANAR